MADAETTRQITDTKVLAILSHPLRRRLMDVLLLGGPATASVLAEQTGQAVGNVSHHLKMLASVDLVAEAPELARDRRERWWRLVARTVQWNTSDFAGDPASEAVEQAAVSLNVDRQVGFVRAWNDAAPEERSHWGDGPFATATWLRLTPDELRQYGEELRAVMARWSDRELPEDDRERRPVFTFAHGVPARP